MSKGNHPLLCFNGQPWSFTAPLLDHPLRNVPLWVQTLGKKLLKGRVLTKREEEKLVLWRSSQGEGKGDSDWPDDHAVLKRRWFEVQ